MSEALNNIFTKFFGSNNRSIYSYEEYIECCLSSDLIGAINKITNIQDNDEYSKYIFIKNNSKTEKSTCLLYKCFYCNTSSDTFIKQFDFNNKCNFCGADRAYKCKSCGKIVESLERPSILFKPYKYNFEYCKTCKKEIEEKENNHFCVVCGTILNNENLYKHGQDNAWSCKKCKKIFQKEKNRLKQNITRAGGNLSIIDWFEILKKYNYKCAYCGENFEVLEHIVPVSNGGETTKNNVVPSCNKCNISLKGNKLYLKKELLLQ